MSIFEVDSDPELPPQHSVHMMGDNGGMFTHDSDRFYHTAWIANNLVATFKEE